MNEIAIANSAYIVAAILFIMSLAGLSKHESSKTGIVFGISGMTVAIAATIWLSFFGNWSEASALSLGLLAIALVLGAAIGGFRRRRF